MPHEQIYPVARTDSLTRWRDQLKEALSLETDPGDRYLLKFYDSFDWRLYSAGLNLECRIGSSNHRLRLIDLDKGSPLAEQSVWWDEKRFVWELPEGNVKEKVAPLLGVRAFLPLAVIQVRSYCLRQDDKKGKTRARLYVESLTLMNPAGTSKVLQKRLRLQMLRGYEKAFHKLAHKLEKQYRLSTDDNRLFEKALENTGRYPGDYSSKLNVKLETGVRADEAVRVVLRDLLITMTINEQGVIDDLDSEFLHDFRVAIRRTRCALGELKRVFPPAAQQRFKGEFAWLGGLTSPARDLDVYLIKFNRYQEALPESLREGLEPLRTFLKQKKDTERTQQLVPGLKSGHYRTLKRQWQRFLNSPLGKRPTAPHALKTIDEVADHCIWRSYRRVMRKGAAITDESLPSELHELRKSCKKLRYLMEFFQSLYSSGKIRVLIKELRKLQDNLGDFQDLSVQIGALAGFSGEMRQRAEYSAETGHSMDALIVILKTEMVSARNGFNARFKGFSKKNTRAGFKKLFNSDHLESSE